MLGRRAGVRWAELSESLELELELLLELLSESGCTVGPCTKRVSLSMWPSCTLMVARIAFSTFCRLANSRGRRRIPLAPCRSCRSSVLREEMVSRRFWMSCSRAVLCESRAVLCECRAAFCDRSWGGCACGGGFLSSTLILVPCLLLLRQYSSLSLNLITSLPCISWIWSQVGLDVSAKLIKQGLFGERMTLPGSPFVILRLYWILFVMRVVSGCCCRLEARALWTTEAAERFEMITLSTIRGVTKSCSQL